MRTRLLVEILAVTVLASVGLAGALPESAPVGSDLVQSEEESVGGWWERTFRCPYPGDATQVGRLWDVGSYAVTFQLSARNAGGRNSFGYYQRSEDGEVSFHEVFAWSDPVGTVKTINKIGTPFGLYLFNEEGMEPPCRWFTEDNRNRGGARQAWVFGSPPGGWLGWAVAFEDVSLAEVRDHNDLIVTMTLIPGIAPAQEGGNPSSESVSAE